MMQFRSQALLLYVEWTRRVTTYFQDVELRNGERLAWLAIAIASVPLVLKYWYETQRILGFLPGTAGGIDLGFYYRWTRSWFSGINIFVGNSNPQGYPPASMVLLYPLTGMWTMEQARGIWAFTMLLALAVVAYTLFRALDVTSLLQRAALLALLLYINGVSVTYGNGQATLHVLALVLCSTLLLQQRPVEWRTDLLASALFVGALLKPNLSAPYLWLCVFFPGKLRLRPLCLIATGYLALSLFAAQFVNTSPVELFRQFLSNRLSNADISIDPNLHFVLGNLGLDAYLLVASAICFFGLGGWIYLNRSTDIWLLLAVVTLVMRFWGFHWVYDNAFLIIPQVALLRIYRHGSPVGAASLLPAVLVALNVIAVLPPGNLGGQARILQLALALFQGGVWAVTLVYFLGSAGKRSLPKPGVRIAGIPLLNDILV